MLPPSGNLFKCYEEVLSLQPMIPPKCFDVFPSAVGCSQGPQVRSEFSLNYVFENTVLKTARMLKRSRCVQIFLLKTVVISELVILNEVLEV